MHRKAASKGKPNRRCRVAIIVFAREPVPGKTKTRLIPALGPEGAAALADAFNRDAMAKAKQLHPADLVIAGTAAGGARRSRYFRELARQYGAWVVDQGPGDLGARMADAMRPFTSGAGAILLGTDTPSLPLRMLARGADLLTRCPVVLGPALDGGYYLIGVRGKLPAIFNRMEWGKPDVLAKTLERLRAAHEPHALGPWWYDVDRIEELALLKLHLENRLRLVTGRAMPLGRPHPCPLTAALLSHLPL